MQDKIKRSQSQWVELLAKKELPAITSIAGMLDKFANDDTSSIPQLSKAILHDQSLSSCVLKVANNAHHMSVRKVTTVSRASIVLGIQAVKNICLTSKILEGLLHSKNLGPEVYQRLTMLMANAFYAGLLAKMMVPDHSDDTQEEVYLAAMLYHIGETSFWSTGDPLNEKLIKEVDLPDKQFQKYCAQETGIKFKNLSIGLAKTWNLSELLIKALDNPASRTVEMQTISLANQLSAAIASPPATGQEFDKILKNISQIMKIDIRLLKSKIEGTREFAIELLSSYGASILESHIKPLPKVADFKEKTKQQPKLIVSKEKSLLQLLKSLSKLVRESKNINDFLTLTLQQNALIFNFDRSSFWMLSSDKHSVSARTSYDKRGVEETFHSSITINESMNIVSHVIEMDNAVLVNNYRDPKWSNYMSLGLEKVIADGCICFSPVKIGDKTIGIISAQNFDKSRKISEDDFSQFCFLVEHLNMCLSMIFHR